MTTAKPGFSLDLAVALIESAEPFPVDFDHAWRWIGYTRKATAREVLVNNFEDGIDFFRFGCKSPQGGRPGESIMLSIDCFKSLGMMAGTAKGKQVRRYFLDCERIAKSVTNKLTADIAEIKQALQQLATAQAVLPGGELKPEPLPLYTNAELSKQNRREMRWATVPNNQVYRNCESVKQVLRWDERQGGGRKYWTADDVQQRCWELSENGS